MLVTANSNEKATFVLAVHPSYARYLLTVRCAVSSWYHLPIWPGAIIIYSRYLSSVPCTKSLYGDRLFLMKCSALPDRQSDLEKLEPDCQACSCRFQAVDLSPEINVHVPTAQQETSAAVGLSPIGRYRCPKCHSDFCNECDVYVHEVLHTCPGCA